MRLARENWQEETGPQDLKWLLRTAGPYFGTDPSDQQLHDTLDRFGRFVWEVPSMSQRELGRQVWVEALRKYQPFIPAAWRLVQRAIDAGQTNGVATEPLRWYTIKELAGLTAPAPLLGSIIAEGSFAMMYGAQGATKTFQAIGMSFSIATGQPWHGVDVTQGPVAYILGEGRGGINARVEAWGNAHGMPDNTPFRLLPQPVDFLDPKQVTALLASLESWDIPPKLTVVDTLYRSFGGSENDTADMAAFIAGVGRLQRETGSAVLVLHHPGHDTTRGRGHSALPQAVDTIIKVERDKNSGIITLSCDKQRDGAQFAKRLFRLCPQPPSMILELAERQLPARAQAALAALNTIAAWDGATYTDWRKAAKQGNSTFNRSLERLIQGDCVEKSADDTYQITAKGCEILGLDRGSYSHPFGGVYKDPPWEYWEFRGMKAPMIDPARLARAVWLEVQPVAPGRYLVRGGADDHFVEADGGVVIRHCPDAKRVGDNCKHSLALRLRAGDGKVIDALRQLVPNPKYFSAKRRQGAA